MALAVCLLLDARSDVLVRDLWSRLEDAGVPTLASHTHRRHQPHLSYVVLRRWDLTRAQEALAALPPAEPWAMSFHGTLAFPRGRAALAPAVTADMALRQWRIATALAATDAELHRNYLAGQWVPHVSVATRAPGTKLTTVVKAIATCCHSPSAWTGPRSSTVAQARPGRCPTSPSRGAAGRRTGPGA